MKLGKFPTFFMLMAFAACAAAIFGALHNQLSYTVGPDYFHSLKFAQFAIPPEMPPRLGAALVGAQASWWMGAAVAGPAFIYGLFSVPNAQSYLAAGLGAIGLVIVLATMAALTGLIGGLVADNTGLLDGVLRIPQGVDQSDFLRAGFMHEAAYIAGALGGLLAFWPIRRARGLDLRRAG
ncbi:hypothetical protein LSUCC0031_11740 [Rhodobacterales bacterium LSUCC0031]|nr:hypothetical protein [Rhodobacterales bacterium LSUCC0031]